VPDDGKRDDLEEGLRATAELARGLPQRNSTYESPSPRPIDGLARQLGAAERPLPPPPPPPPPSAENVLNSDLSGYGYRRFRESRQEEERLDRQDIRQKLIDAHEQSERSAEQSTVTDIGEKPVSDNDSSEKNFGVAVAVYVGLLVTGLLLLGEHELFSTSWWYGAAYTVGGGVGAVSVTPLFRNHFPRALGILRAPTSLWAAATVPWLLLALNAGLTFYDHFGPKTATSISAGSSPERWPALTSTQADALTSRLRFIPPEDIIVACETLNCKDLADGLAAILQKTPGWHVSVLHRGGFDITGVTGIQLNPNEPATEALRDAIEATAGLAVKLGPNTRKDLGADAKTFLVVGTRPF
jgi:hypothetical protein